MSKSSSAEAPELYHVFASSGLLRRPRALGDPLRSTSSRPLDEEELRITGELTIPGVTQEVVLHADVQGTEIDRWGNNPLSTTTVFPAVYHLFYADEPATRGAGTVHHIAWSVYRTEMEEWRARVTPGALAPPRSSTASSGRTKLGRTRFQD